LIFNKKNFLLVLSHHRPNILLTSFKIQNCSKSWN